MRFRALTVRKSGTHFQNGHNELTSDVAWVSAIRFQDNRLLQCMAERYAHVRHGDTADGSDDALSGAPARNPAHVVTAVAEGSAVHASHCRPGSAIR